MTLSPAFVEKLCACGCGKIVRRYKSQARTATLYLNQEHRTKHRRNIGTALEDDDAPAVARLVSLTVFRKHQGDHLRAANMIGLHPNHLRAIMRGERCRYLDESTIVKLSHLGIPINLLRQAIPLTLRARRQEICRVRNSERRWTPRRRQAMRSKKLGVPNPKNQKNMLRYWSGRTVEDAPRVRAALQIGRNLQIRLRLKKALKLMKRRWHQSLTPEAIERFITRWSGRLGVRPDWLRREVEIILGIRRPTAGQRLDLDLYVRVRSLQDQGLTWSKIKQQIESEFGAKVDLKRMYRRFKSNYGAPVARSVRRRRFHSRQAWKETDNTLLRTQYQRQTQRELAGVLNRTESAIAQQARKLGLKKRVVVA